MLKKPAALKQGDTLGIFTPSSPSYTANEEKFSLGIKVLQNLGFRVKVGALTQRRGSQGYRSGTPEERADEFMALYRDPEVTGLIATIGGANSSSLIPPLDFDWIAKNPKVVCGYSDVTSLHLAIRHYSKVSTFYGPALMTWFSEWPEGEAETIRSFLAAVSSGTAYPRRLEPFPRWSNHFRDWVSSDWKTVPREWNPNPGWRALQPGQAEGPIIAANLNTLVSAAGTPYFPDLRGRILLIEEMSAPFSRFERNLMQLRLVGGLDELAGLILGKTEHVDAEGADFSLDDLFLEILGDRPYPVVSEFDLSHTGPMHTIAQESRVRLIVRDGFDVEFEILESMVTG